ncbi:type II secretion system minor pseudopilin GspK [Candidatus Rariloculus sp.]|uniref:type II secretion system minor pseudopilin GspK n=1 Tax=Candidatus Rariloculus sp. TaxID=3101265 RepID=UPI003D0F08B9
MNARNCRGLAAHALPAGRLAGLRATRDFHHGLLACRHRQRGVAVLTAMLVVTVGTILAVNLMWQAQLDQRRTAAALAADQGLMYTQGAEAWAADILRQDLVDSPFSDNLAELWATEIPPLPVEGGVITGRIEDLHGRFNLNNLVDESGEEDALALRQFERLLAHVGLDPVLAGAIVDWLDPDADPRFPDGAEDAAYGNTNPQYRTANVMITSPSELMAVTGFDAESYALVAPYVTALPIGTRLNVNTAPALLLATLSDELDLSTAASLVEERGAAGFVDIETVFADLVPPEMFEHMSVDSDHFLLTGTVVLGMTQLRMRSVLQRDTSGLTRVLFRSQGVE